MWDCPRGEPFVALAVGAGYWASRVFNKRVWISLLCCIRGFSLGEHPPCSPYAHIQHVKWVKPGWGRQIHKFSFSSESRRPLPPIKTWRNRGIEQALYGEGTGARGRQGQGIGRGRKGTVAMVKVHSVLVWEFHHRARHFLQLINANKLGFERYREECLLWDKDHPKYSNRALQISGVFRTNSPTWFKFDSFGLVSDFSNPFLFNVADCTHVCNCNNVSSGNSDGFALLSFLSRFLSVSTQGLGI